MAAEMAYSATACTGPITIATEEAYSVGTSLDAQQNSSAARRKAIAAKSRADRLAQDAARRRANTELQQRIREVEPCTNDRIDQAELASRRAEFAAAAEHRHKEEKADQRKWNTYIRERIKAAVDEDGCDDEKEKFRAMVEKHELTRESEVTASAVRTFNLYSQHKQVGDVMRREKEDLGRMRDQQKAEWRRHGQELARQRKDRQDAVQRVQREVLQQRREEAQSVKFEKQNGSQSREYVDYNMWMAARQRAHEARALDARLDKAEAAVEARARIEGTQMRQEIEISVKEKRTRDLASRKEQAAAVRETVRQAAIEASEQVAHEQSMRAQEKRKEARLWRFERYEAEELYVEKARANKEASAKRRAAIKAKSLAVQERKKKQADTVRNVIAANSDFQTAFEAARKHKKQVRDAYAHRYASADDANAFSTSPLGRLHAWSRWALDGFPDDNA